VVNITTGVVVVVVVVEVVVGAVYVTVTV